MHASGQLVCQGIQRGRSVNWQCRFYRGLHNGVEAVLPQGRCVIGSDPLQADMVLVDEGIAPSHLVLQIDEQGVRLLEACTELWQEGKVVTAGEYLQAGLRLEAGKLLWTFCAEGQSFPAETQRADPGRGAGCCPSSLLGWLGVTRHHSAAFAVATGASDRRVVAGWG